MPETSTMCAVAVFAVIAAGCSPATEAGSASGRPAIGLIAPAADVHPGGQSDPPADLDHHDDPVAVAEMLVVDALADQGLAATITASELLERDGPAASVEIVVLHSIGRGHPHQSLYTIDLEWAEGRWRSVGFSETVR